MVLASTPEGTTLAEMANKIIEVAAPHLSSVNAVTTPTDPNSHLQRQLLTLLT